MNYTHLRTFVAASLMAVCLAGAGLSADEPQLSPRMEQAKDYIAEEQWTRAIEILTRVAVDQKEKNRDEALYWLAHSQNQAKNLVGAVETINQLERQFPKSRWVKPAGYIRVELAQKLRRNDVLWYAATASGEVVAAPVERPRPFSRTTRPAAPVEPIKDAPPTAVVSTFPAPAAAPAAGASGAGGRRAMRPTATPMTMTPMPPTVWVSQNMVFDNDVRIQALSSLLKTDANKVIPMLREIALESRNPNEASRAVFVLAQSGRPEAQSAVLEVAKVASEPVRVAAVRELGRFGGATVQRDLLEVYGTAKPRVKYQVVNALGERAATTALLQIVESESDAQLRNIALVTLGQAGGRAQLLRLYARASADVKRPIILGLFNARAEDELIRIAQQERDATIRSEIHSHLRLLGTPKAKAYLEQAVGRR